MWIYVAVSKINCQFVATRDRYQAATADWLMVDILFRSSRTLNMWIFGLTKTTLLQRDSDDGDRNDCFNFNFNTKQINTYFSKNYKLILFYFIYEIIKYKESHNALSIFYQDYCKSQNLGLFIKPQNATIKYKNIL